MQINKQLRKEIQKTIKFMETHSWATGAFRREFKRNGKKQIGYCLLGAYSAANKINEVTRFSNAFQAKFGMYPTYYNDDVATKKERVIAKLKRMLVDSKP